MTFRHRIRYYLMIYVPLLFAGMGVSLYHLFSSGVGGRESLVTYYVFFSMMAYVAVGSMGIAVAIFEMANFLLKVGWRER